MSISVPCKYRVFFVNSLFTQLPVLSHMSVSVSFKHGLVAGSPAVAMFREDIPRTSYLRMTELALLGSHDTYRAKLGFLGDFQFEVLIDHLGESEDFCLNSKQEARHNLFKSLEGNVAASAPEEVLKSDEYVHEVFQVAMRRLMPYNWVVNGLDFEYYGRLQKPAGQLVRLQTLVVGLHVSHHKCCLKRCLNILAYHASGNCCLEL